MLLDKKNNIINISKKYRNHNSNLQCFFRIFILFTSRNSSLAQNGKPNKPHNFRVRVTTFCRYALIFTNNILQIHVNKRHLNNIYLHV